MNRRFLFILTISLMSLVALVGGVFLFFKDNSFEFTKSGYILETAGASRNHYYFNEGTKYKEDLDDKYKFTDVDNTEVLASKDNFVHYLDGSISFLKNGVLLDLDNVNSTIIPYYNITDRIMINYNQGSYYIYTIDKKLVFYNWIGRISDNKYIVAGKDVSLKSASNPDKIEADYYEIIFTENGVVNIENQEVSYQMVAEGTIVFVGEHIVIDLGNQRVYYDEEEKLSLSQMTINGDENIEIIPEEEGEGNTVDNNTVNNADNDGGTGGGGGAGNPKEAPTISLVDASVNANKISMTVQVVDKDNVITNNLIVNIINTTTGKRVYSKVLDVVDSLANVNVETLSPDSNYILSIVSENDGEETQYFQKLFRTDTLGISLEKGYATTDSLSYLVKINDDSKVSSVNVYIYDENYDPVMIRAEGETEVNYYTVSKGDAITGKEITFSNLTKNTSYNVVLNNVVYNNVEYIDKYMITKTNKTLKESPRIGELSASISEDKTSFSLSIGNIEDVDKSITNYKYLIYRVEDLSIGSDADPIKVIDNDGATSLVLNIDGEEIQTKEDYRFRVIAEYYDNEKYGEYLTGLSSVFVVSDKPYLTFTNSESTSFNQIVGTITLNDKNCTVSFENRSCDPRNNNIILEYKIKDTLNSDRISNLTFDPDTLEYDLNITGLIANSEYEISVYGNVDFKEGYGIREGYLIDTFVVNTEEIGALTVSNWSNNESTFGEPINVSAKLNSLTNDTSFISNINSLTFNLYTGQLSSTEGETPIKTITTSGNIKSRFYDQEFNIMTSNIFGLSLASLKSISGGALNEYYTIEITDALDEEGLNEIIIQNNLYTIKMPPIMLYEDIVNAQEEPLIQVQEILNQNSYISKDNLLDNSTVVGYNISASFGESDIESYFLSEKQTVTLVSVNFYAYDKNHNEVAKKKISLPYEDINGYSVQFYMSYGTDYETNDYDSCDKTNPDNYSCLVRGNNYTFAFDVSLTVEDEDLFYPSDKASSNTFTALKQAPRYKMFISGSTNDSITYLYQFTDIDNALYLDSNDHYNFYYHINSVFKDPLELIVDSLQPNGSYRIFNIATATNSVTFTGFSKSARYDISIRRALSKTGFESDIEIATIGEYTFDGNYDGSSYELPFELSYSINDNRLKVIVLNDVLNQELLNRIAAYELVITAEDDTVYTGAYIDLSTCDFGGTEHKCIILDYATIETFRGKNTTVQLYGYYDNGTYLGFGDINTNLTILQTNRTGTGLANYVKLTSLGVISLSASPFGLYSFNKTSTQITDLRNKIDTSKNVYKDSNYVETHLPTLSLSCSANGVTGNMSGFSSIINPKGISKIEFVAGEDYFRFDSITPKIEVTMQTNINSVVLNISSSSITSTVLEEQFVKEDNQYYFYVDIYKNLSDTEVYRQIKINYNDLIGYEITNFLPNTTYYFRVYAYMYKNGQPTYTRLFDKTCSTCSNGYVTVNYSFRTLNASEIYLSTVTHIGNAEANYTSNPTPDYTTRLLRFVTRLSNNKNYTLKYELSRNQTILNTWEVTDLDVAGTVKIINSNIDIFGNDFVFGSNYYNLKVYAVTTVLNDSLVEVPHQYLLHEGLIGDIPELVNPTFSVVKSSGYDNETSSYYLEFKVTPNDINNVIINGEYYLELVDENGNIVASANNLDASIFNYDIVFKNGVTGPTGNGGLVVNAILDTDKEYNLIIYADVFKNNLSLINKEISEGVNPGTYTNSTIKSQFVMYTVGDAGVSLGNLVLVALENNVTISFIGGSNIAGNGTDIPGITEIMYTIKRGSSIIASECYVIGNNTPIYCENEEQIYTRKNFVYTASEDYYKIVLQGTGATSFTLIQGVPYVVYLQVYSGLTKLRPGSTMSYSIIYENE